MMEYFLSLCLAVVVVTGTPVLKPKDQWQEETRRVANHAPASDSLQMATSSDQKQAGTGHGLGHGHGFEGLGHGGHHGNNYFQYAHNPDYGHYEFGYRRGNDHHFREHYEKAHDWKFKTKVKWGDKYGGYGEHYWDYNHVDKGYDGGHGGGGHDGGHGHGHYSEQVPVVSQLEAASKADRNVKKRESTAGNRRVATKTGLSIDRLSGKVTDERTGRTYWLQPTEPAESAASQEAS